MRASTALLLSILTVVRLSAFADIQPSPKAESCDDAMSAAPAPVKIRKNTESDPYLIELNAKFDAIERELYERKMYHLLDGYSDGQVKVHVMNPDSLRRDITIRRIPMLHLSVRRLDFSTERNRELALWKVAEGLYRLEMRRSFRTSMIHANKAQTNMDKGAKAPGFLSVSQGLEVFRNNRLERIDELQNEMYRLLSTFKHVKPSDVIPVKDPAGKILNQVGRIMGDPGRYIAINQKDFEIYKEVGPKGVAQAVAQRHSAMLWRAYMMKRIKLWIAGVTAVAVVVGGLIYAWPSGNHQGPPATPQEIVKLEKDVREGHASPAEIVRLYVELNHKVKIEKSKVIAPDAQGIVHLNKEITDLETAYPELLNKVNP